MTQILPLRCTIDRFEGHTGVLLFDESDLLGPLTGQELVLPKRLLPAGSKEGDTLVVELLTDKQATEAKEDIARKVLEDILNGR